MGCLSTNYANYYRPNLPKDKYTFEAKREVTKLIEKITYYDYKWDKEDRELTTGIFCRKHNIYNIDYYKICKYIGQNRPLLAECIKNGSKGYIITDSNLFLSKMIKILETENRGLHKRFMELVE